MSVATLDRPATTPVLDLTPGAVLVVCLSDDDEIDALRAVIADRS